MKVSNPYKRNVVEVLKNSIEMCSSVFQLQLYTHSKEHSKHPIKTALFSRLQGKTRQRILRIGLQKDLD